jgi:hypothetical protein
MALLGASTTAFAIPQLMNYQGILKDGTQTPVTSTVDVLFAIWDDPIAGDSLWSETHSVTPDGSGRFNVILGMDAGIPDSVLGSDAYLSMKVESDSEMSPRTRIVWAVWAVSAYRVGTIDGAAGGAISSRVAIQDNLTVTGNLRTTGKSTIGPDNVNTGRDAFVTGRGNTASGAFSSVGGGFLNHSSDSGATIGGGMLNVARDSSATVGGGFNNIAEGFAATVAGGTGNIASGDQATVGGGAGNTASVWFCTVSGGYYNSATGAEATVPGGNGNTAAGVASFAAGNLAGANHDGTYVWSDKSGSSFASTGENQYLIRAAGGVGIGTAGPTEQLEVAGTVYSTAGGFKFPDGTIQTTAVTGSGTPAGGWIDGGTVVRLETSTDSVGIGVSNPSAKLDVDGDLISSGKAAFGPGNDNTGMNAFVAGENNAAIGEGSTVGGGFENAANAIYATVGGGAFDTAGNAGSTVGGGSTNSAAGIYTTVSGGQFNAASESYATVSGGRDNTARGYATAIGGGTGNDATQEHSTVAGGDQNTASASFSSVGGGEDNTASGDYSTVAGGLGNEASGLGATVSGGGILWDAFPNRASGIAATIGGGAGNTANRNLATIAGGQQNSAAGDGSAVGGGAWNQATGDSSTIGGGVHNTASGDLSTIAGGFTNQSIAYASTVSGGDHNQANGSGSFVGGGRSNGADGNYSVVTGGGGNLTNANHAGGDYSIVGGGARNSASGVYSVVGGGYENLASGVEAIVPGGTWNAARGRLSLAMANNAKANHDGSVVIAANSSADDADSIRSGGDEQMVLRADGGLYITNQFEQAPYDTTKLITTRGGAFLSGSGWDWTNASGRDKKENFQPVDGRELLEKIARIPIERWNYKGQDINVRHIGPIADDFNSLFGVGADDESISTIDPAGVALAAIQELHKRTQRIDELERELTELRNLVQEIIAEQR